MWTLISYVHDFATVDVDLALARIVIQRCRRAHQTMADRRRRPIDDCEIRKNVLCMYHRGYDRCWLRMNPVVGRSDSQSAVAKRVERYQGDFLRRHANVSLEHLNSIAVVRGDQLCHLNRVAEFTSRWDRKFQAGCNAGAARTRLVPGCAGGRKDRHENQ